MHRLLVGSLFALISLASAHADILTEWTFEGPNAPGTVSGKAISGLLPAIGSGDASGSHANAATVYSSQLGNGSASALSATTWSSGDYWQFHTSTLGYSQLQLSWDQCSGTGTAATNFSLLYSTDGQNFTSALNNYQVFRNWTGTGGGGGVWNATTTYASFTRTLDLSAIAELQNAPNVYFRLVDNIPGSDYSRIDNFTLSGVAVPEPSALALLGLGALLGAWHRRR